VGRRRIQDPDTSAIPVRHVRARRRHRPGTQGTVGAPAVALRVYPICSLRDSLIESAFNEGKIRAV